MDEVTSQIAREWYQGVEKTPKRSQGGNCQSSEGGEPVTQLKFVGYKFFQNASHPALSELRFTPLRSISKLEGSPQFSRMQRIHSD